MDEEMRSAVAPRWQGKPGRLEVWYATLSGPSTQAGLWVHYETVAPTSGDAPYAHGWATWFPPDGPPRTGRFGPAPVGPATGAAWFEAAGARAAHESLTGRAGSLSWAELGLVVEGRRRAAVDVPAGRMGARVVAGRPGGARPHR